MNELREILMYTDGSCLDNGKNGTGGYCALLQTPNKSKEKIVKGAEKNTTSNRMEIKAIIEGLKALTKPSKVYLYSDSNITVRGINEWLKGWIGNGWKNSSKKTVSNVDLWKEYLEVSKAHTVIAKHIKAHSGHPENERVNTIAKQEAMKLKRGSHG